MRSEKVAPAEQAWRTTPKPACSARPRHDVGERGFAVAAFAEDGDLGAFQLNGGDGALDLGSAADQGGGVLHRLGGGEGRAGEGRLGERVVGVRDGLLPREGGGCGRDGADRLCRAADLKRGGDRDERRRGCFAGSICGGRGAFFSTEKPTGDHEPEIIDKSAETP